MILASLYCAITSISIAVAQASIHAYMIELVSRQVRIRTSIFPVLEILSVISLSMSLISVYFAIVAYRMRSPAGAWVIGLCILCMSFSAAVVSIFLAFFKP